MSTLLVTGATGFLGSWIVQILGESETGCSLQYDTVRLLVRNPGKVKNLKSTGRRIEIAEGDLLDHGSLAEAASGVSAVIHAAAVYDDRSPKKTFYRANVEGTKALLESLPAGTRFVLTSTYGVYGFPNREKPITEDFEPKKPIWHYQKSKKAQEDLARRLCAGRNIRFVALRPPTIIGPRDLFVLPTLMRAIRDGKMMLINGGGNIIPFVHGADAADAHLRALQRIDQNDGESFHFTGFHTSFREFIAAICEAMGIPPVEKSVPLPLAYAAGGIGDALRMLRIRSPFSRFTVRFISSHSLLDTSKIEQRLGFKPRFDFQRTISDSVDWYRRNMPEPR
jgi:nucleoside-diphosphate-sugar epimerase